MSDAALMTLVRTIVTADDTAAFRLLAANPALAKARFEIGATRQTAETFYLDTWTRSGITYTRAILHCTLRPPPTIKRSCQS